MRVGEMGIGNGQRLLLLLVRPPVIVVLVVVLMKPQCCQDSNVHVTGVQTTGMMIVE